jgi:hypothetical protein
MSKEVRDGSKHGVGNRNDRKREHEAKPSHGSHVPANKLNVGGTAKGSEGGNAFAEGNPKLSSKDINPLQRAAQKEHEAAENGLKDTSKRDVYGRKK